MAGDSASGPEKEGTVRTDLVSGFVADNQATVMQVEDLVAKMVVETNELQHAATSFVHGTIGEIAERVDSSEDVF